MILLEKHRAKVQSTCQRLTVAVLPHIDQIGGFSPFLPFKAPAVAVNVLSPPNQTTRPEISGAGR